MNIKYEPLIEQLRDNGYNDLYKSIIDTDKYYDTNAKFYCIQCREILDNFIAIIEEIIHIEHTNDDKFTCINNLSKRDEIDDELVLELTNMRIISNKYHHFTNKKGSLNPDDDRRTLRIAIIKITDKLLVLPEIYQKAEEARQRKKAEIERKRREAEEAEKRRKLEAEIERKRREAEIKRKRREEWRKECVEHAKRKKRQQKWAVAGGFGAVLGILVFILKLLEGGSKRD